MCVFICVTKPAAEQPQSAKETVNPATVVEKKKKDDDDDDSESTHHVESEDEKEVVEGPLEEIVEDATEPEVGFRRYRPGDEDKGRFDSQPW